MKKIFCTAIIIACLANNAWAADTEQEILIASDLSIAVSADLAAAQAKYLNKTVVIKGVVARTYTSRYLTPNVELVGEGSKITFVLPYGGITRGLGQLSDFKPGQVVTMQGKIIAIREEAVVLKETIVVE